MKIFTHIKPDLDTVASVWAVRKYVPGAAEAPVVFKPAGWDGAGMAKEDIAVDIQAGGRGVKGKLNAETRTQHSCFATIMEQYAPELDRRAMERIINYVDAHDAHGNALKQLINVGSHRAHAIKPLMLNSVLYAFAEVHGKDELVVARMTEVLDGLLVGCKNHVLAHDEAVAAQVLPGGRVAIVRNAKYFETNGILFAERMMKAIVFVDGYNLGVMRSQVVKASMSDEYVQAVVEAAGEEAEWFAHVSGFLYARGTRKSPAMNASRVDPEALAKAVDDVLTRGAA